MPALTIHGPNDIRLDPTRVAKPGPKDVVLNVAACGVCGSDLTYIKNGTIGARPFTAPIALGHEAAGVVAEVGSEVKGLKPGMRVILNPMHGGDIGGGGEHGAFAETILVRDAQANHTLFPIPDDMPFDIAALAEPLAVSLHGVNRGQVNSSDKAVVFGAGPIGLGQVLWLKRRGLTEIVSIDLSEGRLKMAAKLGAKHTIVAGQEDVAARLGQLYGREKMIYGHAVGVDVYFDAAGVPSVIPDIVAMARMHSRLVMTAVYPKPVPLNLVQFLTKEMTFTSAIGYPDEFPEVIATLKELGPKARDLISHHYMFADVLQAIETARFRDSGKVMVEFPAG
jgi:(R,R)-butanediol dehydrogenase / meso-butanediol dehydrogenase / diacetyl reductase